MRRGLVLPLALRAGVCVCVSIVAPPVRALLFLALLASASEQQVRETGRTVNGKGDAG